MAWARDWRLFGAAAVIMLGGLTATLIMLSKPRVAEDSGPDAQGGLVVQTGRDDDIKLDPRRPLRCFVGGLFVGEMPVSACAVRNGVGVGALDVGVDRSGALAGGKGPGADVTPLPPPPPSLVEATSASEPDASGDARSDDGSDTAVSGGAGTQACWRYAGATWTRLPDMMTRSACLETLYDGRCLSPGAASYGRWGDRTLRLTSGRIEVSTDNRVFKTLAQQGPGCSVN